MPLMTRGGKLRSVLIIVRILGKGGLCKLGFNISWGKLMAQQCRNVKQTGRRAAFCI